MRSEIGQAGPLLALASHFTAYSRRGRPSGQLPRLESRFDSLEFLIRVGNNLGKWIAMYGMINQAILEFLCEEYGTERSDAVRARAACEEKNFASMQQYPDEVSYALIGAASEILGEPADVILDKVGEYWVGFALRSDYADLLWMAGRTLPEVLQNLDHLHTRIGQSFQQMEPPSFWCDDITEGSLVLHYASERAGLGPMVIGLVRGLGRMLGYETKTEPVATESEESMKFLVQFVESQEVQGFSNDRSTAPEEAGRPVKAGESIRDRGTGLHTRS